MVDLSEMLCVHFCEYSCVVDERSGLICCAGTTCILHRLYFIVSLFPPSSQIVHAERATRVDAIFDKY